jgi:transposase
MTYRELSDKVKSNRGILAILKTRPDRLSAVQKTKLAQFLKDNPAIQAIYKFQQQLHELLMHRAMIAKWCRKAIPQF